MCTAISWKGGSHLFGRTLDLEESYGEETVVVPRQFPIPFRFAGTMASHYAMIGVSLTVQGFPLFFDAANERGLCMAALNFPGNACYRAPGTTARVQDIAPFEMIPWVLGRCASVREARELLSRTAAAEIPFSDAYPLTPLHWILADAAETAVAEPSADGLLLYDNPTDVLTNNPPFPMQMFHLQTYRHLSSEESPVRFGGDFPFEPYSRGLGTIGLPGDYTSPSRFVRAAFVRANISVRDEGRISAFFHMTDAVSVPRGCVRLSDGREVITRYTSLWDSETETYYTTVYENRQIRALRLRVHDLDADRLFRYTLYAQQDIADAIPLDN